MWIKDSTEVAPQTLQDGIRIRWLITDKDGAPNFAMRVIEIDPGVTFPPHTHPYEHEIYVLEGRGVLTNPEGDVGIMEPGKFVFVEPSAPHGYRNIGEETWRFICIIPLQK